MAWHDESKATAVIDLTDLEEVAGNSPEVQFSEELAQLVGELSRRQQKQRVSDRPAIDEDDLLQVLFNLD